MRKLCLVALAVGWLAAAAAPADDNDHVRVVLDVSGSLRDNDPGRLTVLATLLLHDLARPNTTLGDSFEVIPFDTRWRWLDPGDPPPVSSRLPIVARSGQRQAFVRALNQQQYDSDKTYFYPGIKAAIEDLKGTEGGEYDRRVIVLVTDGVPEPEIKEREAELLRTELGPLLLEHHIRLYVLGFSQEAAANRGFFEAMVQPGGVNVGEIFVDLDGSRLLTNMLQIFGRSFGFVPDAARPLPGTASLDLDAGSTPEEVAVVVLNDRRHSPPRLELSAPAQGQLRDPGGALGAGEEKASYALTWVLSPDVGQYGLDTDVLNGSVAVLRPSRLELEILAAPPHQQVDKTMAGTPFNLQVLARQAGGTRGDPGPVKISFRPLGERDPQTSEYRYEGDPKGAQRGPGRVRDDGSGRVYDIRVEFEENPDDPREIYRGWLEVEARRGEALVGSLRGDLAHPVEVHPYLSISPAPLTGDASSTALKRLEQACTTFQLELTAGLLPHPDQPEYGVRAALAPGDPDVLEAELRQATYTLDGRPLEVEQNRGREPGEWYNGRKLARDELLGEHEVCLAMGKPTAGDPAQPIDLPLVLTLLESPYDDFAVIKPFTLRVRVATPSWFQRWRAFLWLALALLALLAALWYLRDRPVFPDDLRYAVGREGASAALAGRPLPEGSLAARLLGLVVERPILVEGEDKTLGWMRPVDEELYQLRPARGVHVGAAEEEDGPASAGKLATVAVSRTYRLSGDRGSYLFRMEYS